MTGRRVLVVDDDDRFRRLADAQLRAEGCLMTSVPDPGQALALLDQVSQDLVITAFRKSSPVEVDLLQRSRAGHPQTHNPR